MGQAPVREPRLPQLGVDELALLVASTHYGEEEIHRLHAQFAADVAGGVVAFSNFQAFLCTVNVESYDVARMLFRGFDANDDGVVTFHELVRGLSAMTRGTNEERLHFAFRMYDEDRNGFLTAPSLTRQLAALEATFGPLRVHGAPPDAPPVAPAEVVAAAMRRCGDGRMTYMDFVEFAAATPAVAAALSLHRTPGA